jgi:hypothetical protein
MLDQMSDDLPVAGSGGFSAPEPADEAIGFDMLAASLRADTSEMGTFLNVLGRKLVDALPEQVRLERERKRFRETDRIRKIEVTLEDYQFDLEEVNGRPVSTISHVVRGMRLKSDEVGLDVWIDTLSRQLAAAAARSAKSRDAIAGLLG